MTGEYDRWWYGFLCGLATMAFLLIAGGLR